MKSCLAWDKSLAYPGFTFTSTLNLDLPFPLHFSYSCMDVMILLELITLHLLFMLVLFMQCTVYTCSKAALTEWIVLRFFMTVCEYVVQTFHVLLFASVCESATRWHVGPYERSSNPRKPAWQRPTPSPQHPYFGAITNVGETGA